MSNVQCPASLPYAHHEDGPQIMCTLAMGHEGEHEDHQLEASTACVLCWPQAHPYKVTERALGAEFCHCHLAEDHPVHQV